jgi:predicted ArsR family transcriptional regulator
MALFYRVRPCNLVNVARDPDTPGAPDPAGDVHADVAQEDAHEDAAVGPSRLAVLKALGDNTRYAIFLELARSPRPLATNDIARTLGLHPNTVRPHLERMRDVGLLELRVDPRGGVGRPQHVYSVAPDAPSLGLEPPAFPLLARMLLRVAADAGAASDDARDAGQEQGRAAAERAPRPLSCVDALVADLGTLGFDPEFVQEAEVASIGFMHCPFRDLAVANPAVVCGLHQGMVEGFVDARGGARVREFRSLVHTSHPCQVDLEVAPTPRPTAAGAR